ncbi:MAG TPA: hypothetical protein VK962_01575 [Actinomycetota bacterium]|jgi:hypothetical protein|nr:hypothetical protein [Actinomycetota bacterium]
MSASVYASRVHQGSRPIARFVLGLSVIIVVFGGLVPAISGGRAGYRPALLPLITWVSAR